MCHVLPAFGRGPGASLDALECAVRLFRPPLGVRELVRLPVEGAARRGNGQGSSGSPHVTRKFGRIGVGPVSEEAFNVKSLSLRLIEQRLDVFFEEARQLRGHDFGDASPGRPL